MKQNQKTLRAIGNSLGIILPIELLRKINVKKGDTLDISKSIIGNSITIKKI